ncbi:hypothetical protein [Leptospira fluminis]|nr:hypothetical protein [Leptospira fluminis]
MNLRVLFSDLKDFLVLPSQKRRRVLLVVFSVSALAVVVSFLLSVGSGVCQAGNCWFGLGVMKYSDGNIYRGSLLLRKANGYGEFVSRKKDRYFGEWSWGKKHGYGIYYYGNGDVYEGQFSSNVKVGFGSFSWKGGLKYVGRWEDGEPSGPGKLLLEDGTTSLDGEYRKGIIYNGKGMYVYDDGTRYVGEWKEGRRNGFGIQLDSAGRILYSGQWVNDHPLGSAPSKGRTPS